MVKVLIPSGALGLGFEKKALSRGILEQPDIIAIDGGSTDSGPFYLGTGTSKYSRNSTKSEWAELIEARSIIGVPLVVGTAGTCGTGLAVDWLVDITQEILLERGEVLKVAIIKSDQNPKYLLESYNDGKIMPLEPATSVGKDPFKECSNIVALAGAEQIRKAISTGADIIIAGRTSDAAIIAALPLEKGCHEGASWHGGKIGECGALCATNPQTGVVVIEFDSEGFTVSPMSKKSRATPETVFSHMLYENIDPFVLKEPGGWLDVTNANYKALDTRRVRVTGSKWVPEKDYRVKLEGARCIGFQKVLLSLVRDTRYINNIKIWTEDIEIKCTKKIFEQLKLKVSAYSIDIRLIGQNASLGNLEFGSKLPNEIGVMAIITAPTEHLADEISKMLNPFLLHHPLTSEEEQPTFAFPFSPADLNRGSVYEFCLNHLLQIEEPMSIFSLETREMGNA